MDGRRGAKSGVDREGRQGQDREVDRGGQGAGRMGASAGQTPPPQGSCSMSTRASGMARGGDAGRMGSVGCPHRPDPR